MLRLLVRRLPSVRLMTCHDCFTSSKAKIEASKFSAKTKKRVMERELCYVWSCYRSRMISVHGGTLATFYVKGFRNSHCLQILNRRLSLILIAFNVASLSLLHRPSTSTLTSIALTLAAVSSCRRSVVGAYTSCTSSSLLVMSQS